MDIYVITFFTEDYNGIKIENKVELTESKAIQTAQEEQEKFTDGWTDKDYEVNICEKAISEGEFLIKDDEHNSLTVIIEKHYL